MVKQKNDLRITIAQNFLCGIVSGVVSKSLTAPLDVVKIRCQVGVTNGLTSCFRQTLRYEGWRAFWKGNLVGCLRLTPFSILQLVTFHRLKMELVDEHGRLSATTAMVAGAGGGIVATLVMYPSDTVKTRLIAQPLYKHYCGIWDAIFSIARHEGVGGFYRGVSTTLLGVVPFSSATFLAYNFIDSWSQQNPSSFATDLIHGCCATAFAQTIAYPFDTIRKKMQAWNPALPNLGGVDVNCQSMLFAVRETFQQYGLTGFWRGNLANLLKVAPYSVCMLMTFEACKNVCLYHNGYTMAVFVDDPKPGIDQSLKPEELEELVTYQPYILEYEED